MKNNPQMITFPVNNAHQHDGVPAEGILHMFIILEKERVCSLDEGFFDKT